MFPRTKGSLTSLVAVPRDRLHVPQAYGSSLTVSTLHRVFELGEGVYVLIDSDTHCNLEVLFCPCSPECYTTKRIFVHCPVPPSLQVHPFRLGSTGASTVTEPTVRCTVSSEVQGRSLSRTSDGPAGRYGDYSLKSRSWVSPEVDVRVGGLSGSRHRGCVRTRVEPKTKNLLD